LIEMRDSMIEVKHLTKIYSTKNRRVVGVDNVSLTINSGEIFGIVGYSGAGKSTLLRCLNLLERPTSGQVIINGTDLTSLNEKRLRKARLKIGMIFQHFHLVSSKTVFENIAFALKAANKSTEEIESRVSELLEIVGLSDKRDAYPSQLSGGQKQRVGIARALANEPTVLLCDEATSALDPSTTKSILSLLKQINETLGITIVLITHEMEVVKDICDRVAVMQDGKIVELGSVYEIFTKPNEPITKSFIKSILRFDIPNHVLEQRKGTIVKIHIRGDVTGESLISDLLQSFNVKGNILYGNMEYIQRIPFGIFIIELVGEHSEVKHAIDYISARIEGLEVIESVA